METNFRPFTFEKDLYEAIASDLNLSFNVSSSFSHITIHDYQLSTWILNENKIY